MIKDGRHDGDIIFEQRFCMLLIRETSRGGRLRRSQEGIRGEGGGGCSGG